MTERGPVQEEGRKQQARNQAKMGKAWHFNADFETRTQNIPVDVPETIGETWVTLDVSPIRIEWTKESDPIIPEGIDDRVVVYFFKGDTHSPEEWYPDPPEDPNWVYQSGYYLYNSNGPGEVFVSEGTAREALDAAVAFMEEHDRGSEWPYDPMMESSGLEEGQASLGDF